jgi:hypothetical protein
VELAEEIVMDRGKAWKIVSRVAELLMSVEVVRDPSLSVDGKSKKHHVHNFPFWPGT